MKTDLILSDIYFLPFFHQVTIKIYYFSLAIFTLNQCSFDNYLMLTHNTKIMQLNLKLKKLFFQFKLSLHFLEQQIMPKLIDNYVLNRKIGAGQYGEVFRGYDRATNNEIAVKSIRRENIKGKFKELLQSEIKVLKSCESPNIIKLYDMKKTNNNYYLVLEYCNDGDLDSYVKKKRYLVQDEAIEIMCQLIHGFHHLYKHNIIHRDLKLANILRHEGVVKIADFGFSKILGEQGLTKTMLGSPLNMAPEVLQNLEYSNKADIYSLGVCYYWMLYGKPPFNAKNIVELSKVIKNQDIDFPNSIQKISPMSQKLIRSMLKVNPKDRISWQELFSHQINNYLEKKMEKQMALTLTIDGNLSENVCKLYLSQNLVIIHPSEFKKREQVVDYAVNLMKDKKMTDFKGNMLRKDVKESDDSKGLKRQQIKQDGNVDDKETEDEKILDQIHNNTFFLLNERNKIIFLLSVMNELRSKKDRKLQKEILGNLVKLVQTYYKKLSKSIRDKQNSYNLKYWQAFIASQSYKSLAHFLLKEEVVVTYELENCKKIKSESAENLKSLVKNYCEALNGTLQKYGEDQKVRSQWIHENHLLDIVELDTLMTKDFDFKHYFCEFGKYEMKQLIESVKNRLKKL